MTRSIRFGFRKEVSVKKTLLLAVAVVAMLALSVAPAFAEGYNDPLQYTRANGYFSGPHGGYATTTNKCQECHSTHYATGGYMLLRANSREAACDYCHGGGGGSTINIQMDNDYRAGNFDVTQASAVETSTMGYGTGHTLGFAGNAPADVRPAYQDANGFACFDCHTPHGNSERVLTTFSNSGRIFGTGAVVVAGTGNSDGTLNTAGEWGIDPTHGNIKIFSGGAVAPKPVWPTGRFLLLKNPHSDAAEGANDMSVSDVADNGQNKIAIDWENPLGPADAAYGGEQDNDPNASFPWDGGNQGFLALSEFCTDCHDGASGASTQKANVWVPKDNQYTMVASHDAQPRH
ncbi:MAG: hypothetical protein HY876_03985 [Coriobacteriales bacterium]|nr:hypothetical protein [Coriobacteriales bacterium]